MGRIEEYLNGLDKRNLTLLYLSVFIIAAAVYYNFNYSVLQQKIETNDAQINALSAKLRKTFAPVDKLKSLKQQLIKVKKQNVSLKEDLKYLNIYIKNSKILHINKKSFFDILQKILQKAGQNNIKASYTVESKTNEFKTYTVTIKGEFKPCEFHNFYTFIKDIEKIKVIKKIKYLNFSKNKNILFEMKVLFWSML